MTKDLDKTITSTIEFYKDVFNGLSRLNSMGGISHDLAQRAFELAGIVMMWRAEEIKERTRENV